MHLFIYQDWLRDICGNDEYMGLYDQITANYEELVNDKMYNYEGLEVGL